MTEEEAIRIAQGLITDFKCESETMVEFCNVVIKALTEKKSSPIKPSGMTMEERKLTIEYLEGIMDNYVEGYGYESHPLPEYYAIESAIKMLKQEPCEDAVSRKAVITIIQNHWWNCRDIDKLVNDLPSITPQEPKWIPVSEKLPEDGEKVLVTAYWHETYQVMMASYSSYYGDGLWWCVPFNNCGGHMQRLKPKEWMPLPTLPTPCKPRESEVTE